MKTIDTTKEPMYIQIYQDLKNQIIDGVLAPDEKLISRRKLASSLDVSVTTVDGAYSQLLAEGFIYSKEKKGYYVSKIQQLEYPKSSISKIHRVEEPITFSNTSLTEIDFSFDAVDPTSFPYVAWQKLLKNSFNENDPNLLKDIPHQGDLYLRSQLSTYLRKSRGVKCEASQVIIGAGTDNLLHTLGLLLRRDSLIVLENPVYSKAQNIFTQNGFSFTHVNIDDQGIMLEPLEKMDNLAVYITPSHQFPLGISMPISRRIKLLNWAANGNNRYIIEDDYDSEFRYGTKAIPSLQSIDTEERVIYMGSFSKSLFPSLRIAYMVLPNLLLKKYYQTFSSFSSPVSKLEQMVLAEFLSSGKFEAHINKTKKIYKDKRLQMVNFLKKYKSIKILGENAGHHILIKNLDGLSEDEMVEKALAKGVKVYPVSEYFFGLVPEKYKSTVILGYGALSNEKIKEGLETLIQAWEIK